MNKESFPHLTLLIVEDNEDVKRILLDILASTFKEIKSASNGCEALEKINSFTPDIIITDIEMPCLDGISLIKKIKTNTYKPIVIVTSAFSNTQYLLEAIDIKVDGYLIKPTNVNLLLEKIKIASNSLEHTNLKYKKLSAREYEVFLDISTGLKPLKIASKYNVKPKTISTYRQRIFEKMGFKSNAELVSYAIKNRLHNH